MEGSGWIPETSRRTGEWLAKSYAGAITVRGNSTSIPLPRGYWCKVLQGMGLRDIDLPKSSARWSYGQSPLHAGVSGAFLWRMAGKIADESTAARGLRLWVACAKSNQ